MNAGQTIDKDTLWKDVLSSIKVSASAAAFNTYLSHTHLVSLSESPETATAEVGCHSAYVKTEIEKRYFGLLQDALVKAVGLPCTLTLTVRENPHPLPPITTEAPLFDEPQVDQEKFLSLLAWARIRPYLTFSNFAVSSTNQMAYAAGEAVAQKPGTTYNPLFLWGGVGVGKTHLANAIAHKILSAAPETKALYCTAEMFTNDIVEGIRNKTTPVFRDKYRKLNILLVDDIQFIAGKDTAQEEFFHTFNAVTGAGGQVILTSDQPPSEIAKLESRLRSRFEAGLIVDIAPPDFELRCAILQIKAKERGIELPMDLIQLIAGNLEDARKMEGFLMRLITELNLKKVNLDEDLIKGLLGKGSLVYELRKKKVAPDEVIAAVSKYYTISKKALLGAARARIVARPRQILMYLLRTELAYPLEEVGRMIGRDHSTVIHAVDRITQLASSDAKIRGDILGIKNSLSG